MYLSKFYTELCILNSIWKIKENKRAELGSLANSMHYIDIKYNNLRFSG